MAQLEKVLPSINTEQKSHFEQLLENGISNSSVEQCEKILARCLKQAQYTDRQARIKAWKAKIAQSEKHAYKWLQSVDAPDDITMKLPDGKTTANTEDQLKAIQQDWLPIFQKFANHLPDLNTFEEHFIPFMKTSPMEIAPLTGPELVLTLAKSKPSAPSLDGWTPQALIALTKWFPSLFDGLASLLNWVEEHAIWPSALCKAYTSLIPKTGMSEAPTSLDFRPISVLSAIYRLWAKARFNRSIGPF